ncbi:NADPH-dependent F420 reductase [Chryseobacterium luquanense]|uniref:NAD(P)-binding domain-containing protein n=1 Tax=Chryseobacterium luquanense TaxID=2983766 RepID=A0ABT3XY73_9FLAO|nr:NAD(P)-binding domain-containing protein [Chryseobacterium luquanense]MCX8530794.1 NAD(P)-binding domain-containing protein [Chryseobacterium luquanense]
MKIGIIGTGAIGVTIAKKMVKAGHTVKVANSDNGDKLKTRAKELGAQPSSLEDVVNNVDVIILSLPTVAIPTLPKNIFSNIDDRVIIVDTSNYYPFRDAQIEDLQNGKTESVWVSEHLGRPVIKAFNNLLAETLLSGGKESGSENRIAMAIAGDDANAKKIIAGLVNDAGFDAVDSGSLENSWRHQPGTPAYCTELNKEELRISLDKAHKEKAPTIRDKAIKDLGSRTTYPSHQEIIEFNRNLFTDKK